MEISYEGEKLYTEQEILDVLLGLDVIYQSKSWIGKKFYWPWHVCLETIAVMLTGNALVNKQVIDEVETMLRKEGYKDDDA